MGGMGGAMYPCMLNKMTALKASKRIAAIEMAQFRRGITFGKARRGRKSAVRDLATAWLRANNCSAGFLARALSSEGVAP